MKLIGIIISVFVAFFGFSQVSYDFSVPLPPIENEITSVNTSYFGTYNSANTNSAYEFNELGIWIISTTFSSISREMVRENSKYIVRNGYLLGISKDSIPCILENDRYHFGLKNKELIIGSNSKNVLKKEGNNRYILNYEENGKFVPTLLTFKGSKLDIQQFDYESETKIFEVFTLFNSINKQKMEFVTITPTSNEWEKFNYIQLIFGIAIEYIVL